VEVRSHAADAGILPWMGFRFRHFRITPAAAHRSNAQKMPQSSDRPKEVKPSVKQLCLNYYSGRGANSRQPKAPPQCFESPTRCWANSVSRLLTKLPGRKMQTFDVSVPRHQEKYGGEAAEFERHPEQHSIVAF
jgi:hypothetical protein